MNAAVRKLIEGRYSKELAIIMAGKVTKATGTAYVPKATEAQRFALASYTLVPEALVLGTARRNAVGDGGLYDKPVAVALAHRLTRITGKRHYVKTLDIDTCQILED